jgi:hypothetical protein
VRAAIIGWTWQAMLSGLESKTLGMMFGVRLFDAVCYWPIRSLWLVKLLSWRLCQMAILRWGVCYWTRALTPVQTSQDTVCTFAADKGHYEFCELLINT